jgi:hypothetical protein
MLIHHLFVRMEKQWVSTPKYRTLILSLRLNACQCQELLVEDIESGRVSSSVQMPDHVRAKLNQYLGGPDVTRARLLATEVTQNRPNPTWRALIGTHMCCATKVRVWL